ncbi:uncharacterized protein TRIVIDRAFT_225879 [Trichoderma virens Gv29-8]|uniref:Uncharacterized protein n=1 Tax=Hypocrea virens (strain Gv29-8 / FGSC 10586) TaxID=413071 RepID=G9N4Q7_HYPVG|nr:uncharacterized protein TRIVIDRAFT_225879 [Trichoderma virens Gv29-8]EHK18581.1 hypothetical protein TRIVIDRAFT_225879 [Trichoderma virens Gv29-8]UKZ52788.1 hypothetical protein TrVGV298_006575 [Trichoderma virens]
MDGPTPIVIGLDGLIKHSLPRIAKIRSAAAAMTNFGRLSPFLKRLQVSVLLLGTIYRKISQYDTIPGSDMCLGICHDSLAQTQGMMEAVLRTDDDNAYKVGREVLIERLPDEIGSFISSVELLRSTYHEAQSEFILESMKELANLRRDYSKHLEECTHKAKQANPNITNTSSEDERTSGSDNGTNLTEPEAASPPNSSQQKPPEKKDDACIGHDY